MAESRYSFILEARAFIGIPDMSRRGGWQLSLDIRPNKWEIPTMTVVTDSKKRVTLRLARPGDRFDVRAVSDGNYILTKLVPVLPRDTAKVRIERRGRYRVGVLEHPIDGKSLKDAVAEFP
jgi:hypothetical protein